MQRLMLLFCLALVPAADTERLVLFQATPPPAEPFIKELTPIKAPTPTPTPDTPLPLSPDRFRFFAVKNYTGLVTWELTEDDIIGIKEFDKASKLFGRIEGGTQPDFYDLPDASVVVWGVKNGQVTLRAYGVVEGKAKRLDTITLLVGPQPPPPGPTPDPLPPGPIPSPAPIPANGFRVMFVYESSTVTPEQTRVINHNEVRKYILDHVVKGDDGRTPEYRCFDQNAPLLKESQLWQNAMARPRSSLPWMIISNGTTGYEGPLPGTHTELLAKLKLHGGN